MDRVRRSFERSNVLSAPRAGPGLRFRRCCAGVTGKVVWVSSRWARQAVGRCLCRDQARVEALAWAMKGGWLPRGIQGPLSTRGAVPTGYNDSGAEAMFQWWHERPRAAKAGLSSDYLDKPGRPAGG